MSSDAVLLAHEFLGVSTHRKPPGVAGVTARSTEKDLVGEIPPSEQHLA